MRWDTISDSIATYPITMPRVNFDWIDMCERWHLLLYYKISQFLPKFIRVCRRRLHLIVCLLILFPWSKYHFKLGDEYLLDVAGWACFHEKTSILATVKYATKGYYDNSYQLYRYLDICMFVIFILLCLLITEFTYRSIHILFCVSLTILDTINHNPVYNLNYENLSNAASIIQWVNCK